MLRRENSETMKTSVNPGTLLKILTSQSWDIADIEYRNDDAESSYAKIDQLADLNKNVT